MTSIVRHCYACGSKTQIALTKTARGYLIEPLVVHWYIILPHVKTITPSLYTTTSWHVLQELVRYLRGRIKAGTHGLSTVDTRV